MVGLGCVVAGGRVGWWQRDGVSLRVLLGVVPLGVWFAVTEHSPLRAARAQWSDSPSGRQCVPARWSHVRPFRSWQGLCALPGAHTSIRTAAVS